ncbi:MAG: 3-deoxy-7-phosphoheptulonate synthase [Verrucomicrobiota bacterium]
MRPTDDLRIDQIDPLLSPELLMRELPLTEAVAELVAQAREQAEAILQGRDDRLLVVVGPCSIHDPAAALEYGKRLAQQARAFESQLKIIMRVYFEKPRTTVGWKGLINDPQLDNTFDINRGLHAARQLLLELGQVGIAAGHEFLDTISPQYVADLIAWGAIGARTTESQVHRELASGLSCPVGFKNGTGGSLKIAIDAIESAGHPHHFLSVTKQGRSAIVSTKGNHACHVILRGGSKGPNYQAEPVAEAVQRLLDAGLPPHLMVDCSHGNSEKDYTRQPAVAGDIAKQIATGSRSIAAVMIESHLLEGKQSLRKTPLTFGQSVTDACIGWDTTVEVLDHLSQAVQTRRELPLP